MTRRTHVLRCWPEPFLAQRCGIKNFEIRRNDREYNIGDDVILCEYDPDTRTYSGMRVRLRITYLTDFEQKSGYVVLGTRPITEV